MKLESTHIVIARGHTGNLRPPSKDGNSFMDAVLDARGLEGTAAANRLGVLPPED